MHLLEYELEDVRSAVEAYEDGLSLSYSLDADRNQLTRELAERIDRILTKSKVRILKQIHDGAISPSRPTYES